MKQLVILAGGRGARMQPLTDFTPKPLIEVNGKPFIYYLIEYAKSIGISKILILAGYKGEMIDEYVLRNSGFGLDIKVIISNTELSTLERVLNSIDDLNEEFCLAYSDNLIQKTKLEEAHFRDFKSDVKALVYGGNGYHNNRNISVDPSTKEIVYSSKSIENEKFKYLNLGWFLIRKSVLTNTQTKKYGSLESLLFDQSRHNVAISITNNIYYSIGSLDRLARTERYLESDRVFILLDRDGTINRKAPSGEYILDFANYEWINNSINLFKFIKSKGLNSIIITNQPAVGRGLATKDEINTIHSKIYNQIQNSNGKLNAILTCFHGWNDNCECRKPNTGLFRQAQEIYDINWNCALYIGDQDRDYEAANTLNLTFSKVGEIYRDLTDIVELWLKNKNKRFNQK